MPEKRIRLYIYIYGQGQVNKAVAPALPSAPFHCCVLESIESGFWMISFYAINKAWQVSTTETGLSACRRRSLWRSVSWGINPPTRTRSLSNSMEILGRKSRSITPLLASGTGQKCDFLSPEAKGSEKESSRSPQASSFSDLAQIN